MTLIQELRNKLEEIITYPDTTIYERLSFSAKEFLIYTKVLSPDNLWNFNSQHEWRIRKLAAAIRRAVVTNEDCI